MRLLLLVAALTVASAFAQPLHAQGGRLCDTAYENCRTPLLELIAKETEGIDVAFWFMEDTRFSSALISRWRAGVPVRVLVDNKATARYPGNAKNLQRLKDAGVPMREKSPDYLHWKTMIFAKQGRVQFSGANYSNYAFAPVSPYTNYVDEIIYFAEDQEIVKSFKRKYDDVWTSYSGYRDYANITAPPTRRYPELEGYEIHPDLNFPPGPNLGFAKRSVKHYDLETTAIDAIIYRITDKKHTDALIDAIQNRGVKVRILTEPKQYRDATRLWHSWNVDRLYMAGAEIRHRRHEGLNHEKLTLFTGQAMTIFGSSNWTESSDNSQLEHNLFTTDPKIYEWARAHFERKWLSTSEYKPFVPLRPDIPVYRAPATGAVNQPVSLKLIWYAGPWAHKYDVYLGTNPTAMVLQPAQLTAKAQGPSQTTTDYKEYALTGLQPGTTYYWKIVSRTMADILRTGQTFSFTTAGSSPMPPGPAGGDVVLYASEAPTKQDWAVVSDATAAGGSRLSNPNRPAAKVAAPLAAPTRYFEMSFTAVAGVPYHLWVRGNATNNSYNNDSVYVQFSDSVSSTGAAIDRIDTTSGLTVTIEACNGCGLSNWGWNDNSYEGLGRHLYFGTSGPQTIRVQVREDGLSIDQIVLSRGPYLSSSPGAAKNDARILPEADGTSP
jgi:phosphatidylserine/phosphatidylglycerophosphate/cardiolipin synthase-like enzyme